MFSGRHVSQDCLLRMRGAASIPVAKFVCACAVLSCATETAPQSGASCDEVKADGSCEADWVTFSGSCHITCGHNCTEIGSQPTPGSQKRASAALPCFDIQPWGPYSCYERRFVFGQCEENWMLQGGFCAFTCGFCSLDI